MAERGQRRIVVATADPIGARMAGPAIRAWHLAEELSHRHEVELVTLATCGRTHDRFRVRNVGREELVELEAWMDVLVFQGGLLRIHPFLATSEKVIVADVYDPFHLENLEPSSTQSSIEDRTANVGHLTGVLNDQLLRADFFLCASERQRDFWLGALSALGRISPAEYDADPTLRRLIDVVPFGLPDDAPTSSGVALRGVVPGIGADDRIVLWGGGIYNWFDPLTLVEAVAALREDIPDVRLFFLGMRHPNPDIPEMSIASRLRDRATELDLAGRHVFFNDGWVPYDERANYLLEADVAVSTHLEHIETAFSFRTRILDYLWAGLPIVTTAGDAFAELVEDEDLGAAVAPGEAAAVEGALRDLLLDEHRRRACAARSRQVAARFRWGVVVAPLLEFCDAPRRSPTPALSLLPQPLDVPPPAPSRVDLRGAAMRARAASRRLRGR